MEAGLWRDLAQFYHAGMRNMCGPYDRSYGMDMTHYLALLGLWIAAALPPADAPLPDVERHFEHAADFFFMPLVALVGSKPPDDVLPHLTAFQGERFLERPIEPNRTGDCLVVRRADARGRSRSPQRNTDGSVSSRHCPLANAGRNRKLAAYPLRDTHSGGRRTAPLAAFQPRTRRVCLRDPCS